MAAVIRAPFFELDRSKQAGFCSEISTHLNARKTELIQEIYKKTSLDAAFIGTLTGTTILFAATPVAALGLLASAGAVVVSNLAFRTGLILLREASVANNGFRSYLNGAPFRYPLRYIESRPSIERGFFYSGTGGVIIHEMGHATTTYTLLKNPGTQVRWTSMGNGFTSFNMQEFSLLGKMIGKNAVRFCIALAGPLAGVAAGTALLVSSIWLKERSNEAGVTTRVMGISSIAHHALYALSALGMENDVSSPHDFVAIRSTGGIHPLTSAIAIIALPAIAYFGAKALKRRLES